MLSAIYVALSSAITSLAAKCLLVPVVWNPWVEKAKEISDFGDDEFPNMVCVESGHVSSPVILLPGTAFEASQILQVSQLICV
jgi:D-hexose-6-phosphate mutarotase